MAWFSPSYLYKKQISIDHTKVSGGADLANFPLLISLIDADLASVANGGRVQSSSGFDIIFTDSTETAKLDHEIEKYTSTTGEIEMWVRIPALSASVDTVIYCYFGNSTISSSQENQTGVWDSNFIAVYHLNQATGVNAADSTVNAFSLPPGNSPVQGPGQIDGSCTFDGATQFFLGNSSMIGNIGACTVSGWVKVNTWTAQSAIVSNYSGGAGQGVLLETSTSSNDVLCAINDGTNPFGFTSANIYTTGTWHLWTMVFDGTQTGNSNRLQFFLDSISQTLTYSGTIPSTTGTSSNVTDLAASQDAGRYLNGALDEVRISNSARSAGWIATEYNNQSTPSAFYAVGQLTFSPAATDYVPRSGFLASFDYNNNAQPINPGPYGVRALGGTIIYTESLRPVAGTIEDILDSRWQFVARALSAPIMTFSSAVETIYSFTDPLTATDSLLIEDAAIPVDSLTATDTILAQDGTLPLDSLTASDIGNLQGWGVDGLTASDSLLVTDSCIPLDALSASDTGNMTRGFIDALTASDSLLSADAVLPVDALSTSDSTLASDGAGLTDALIASDFGGMIRGFVEALVASDTMSVSDAYIPTEVQSVAESLLAGDSASWIDLLSASDSFSAVLSSPQPPKFLTATWVTRDGIIAWITRDEAATWKTRGG